MALTDPPFVTERRAKMGFLIAIVFQVLGLFLVGFGIVPVVNPTAVNNTILGSLVASFSVYLLYWQTKIQKRQTSIEEKMLKYETEPVLEVVDKDPTNNNLNLTITNYGHGVAIDLELCCKVTSPDIDWFEGVTSYTPINKLDDSEVLEDSSIRPQEEPKKYRSESVTVGRISDGCETHRSFEAVMEQLEDEDGEINISLWISAKPKVGNHSVEAKVSEDIQLDLGWNVERLDLEAAHDFQSEY